MNLEINELQNLICRNYGTNCQTNSSFIAKKAKTFDQEKNVATVKFQLKKLAINRPE